jgi:RNA-binding protein 5/10
MLGSTPLPTHNFPSVSLLTMGNLAESAADMRLDGQSDECPQQTPSQFIVVRGLAPSSNETVLAAGMKKLYMSKEDEPKQPPGMPTKLRSTAPTGNTHGLGARPGSLVRVFIVREKSSEISCNYGFAEFSTLEDARAAVAKYNAQPQFTISSKPVTLAFIHSGVFIPYMYPVQEHDRKFTFLATHNPSLRLGYWNPSVYTSELLTFDESVYEDKEQKPEHGKQSSDFPTGKESKKRKADKDLAAPSSKKGGIAMAPQLQMWANKHAELHGSKGPAKGNPPSEEVALATGSNALGGATTVAIAPLSAQSLSFSDLDRMCCLLCRRKFKNEPSLRRHEQGSDLHKVNLEDEQLIVKATRDLKALGKEPVSNYRDRAKERRLVHNQPSRPKPSLPKNLATASKDVDSSKDSPPKATISKGAGLLAKMGWSTGEGLGAAGGGRTDIIETMAYTPGVGLGAEGGKIGDAAEEAARATKNDYSDFISKAKDKARERYEKMG